MRENKMKLKGDYPIKLVYDQFYCEKCKQVKYLKIGNMCVDCKDKQILDEISRIRKHIREHLILSIV
jgi:hypothetical protein